MSRPLVISLVVLAYVAGFTAWGYLWYRLGRRHKDRETGPRWQQGYDTGHRVGWYEASDQLWEDARVLRNRYKARSLPPDFDIGVEYINGYEDAATRLHTYWDKIDEGADDATLPLEGHQTNS